MSQQTFSFEFFPPKTADGRTKLRTTATQLAALGPAYVSVTFGAGGSTQDGTLDTARDLQALGLAVAPHLSCVGSSRDALRAILAAIRRHPVIFPVEVRFVAPDDALLSPAGGRETVYIAAHNYVGMPWEPYFREVQAIGDEHGARPHWGKRHFHTAATLAPLYPGWDRFQAVRAQLDPDGRFANGYVERVLGPTGTRDPRRGTSRPSPRDGLRERGAAR